VSSLLDEFSVAEDLQVNKPRADRCAPQEHDSAKKVESGILWSSEFGTTHGNLSS
jgi:hypothetical protein